MNTKRKPLVRAWAPRRRTGCTTCKIRHTRCDETKPACKKCSDSGRKCDGYAFSSVRQYVGSSSVDRAHSHPSISHSPSLFQNYDSKEHRAFDYFIKYTAHQLCGYFCPDIWLQHIPRLSFDQSALRHAIVAIAAVDEGYSAGFQDLKCSSQLEAYSYALKQYSISVRDLQTFISLGPDNIEPILLCCTLYVSFDSLRGNYSAASTHLKAGMKLLSEYQITDTKVEYETHSTQQEIIRIFTALGVQVGTFLDSVLPVDTISIWEHIAVINADFNAATFVSMDDARHTFHLIFNRFMLHHTRYETQVLQHEAETIPRHVVNVSTTIALLNVMNDLKKWSCAFDTMILQGLANLSENSVKGSVLLKIHHASLSVIVNIAISRESGFNQSDLMPLYETITSLSRSLMEGDASSARHIRSISSDLRLIGPLFTTVTRCTIPRLRWEALTLLKLAQRREGMWDAEVVARIAEGILGLEESCVTETSNLEENLTLETMAVRITANEDEIVHMANKLVIDLDYNQTDSKGQRTLITKRL